MSKVIFGNWEGNKELEGIKLMDMHVHSNMSDGNCPANEIISRARELNIGVCITDHNEIKGSLIASKEILSLISTELTTSTSHDILAYFNNEKEANEFFRKYVYNKQLGSKFLNLWKLKHNDIELIEKLHDYNCFVVLAHPFTAMLKQSHSFFSENKNLLKKVDAIEGVNGLLNPSRNKKAILWAEENKKPITGGSDSHKIKHIGNVVTGCFAETRTEFIENLRKGNNYVIVLKELNVYNQAVNSIDVIKRNIRW